MLDLDKLTSYRPIDQNAVQQKIIELLKGPHDTLSDRDCASFIDYAFLENNESSRRIESKLLIIRKLYDYDHTFRFAGICVYPNYVALARRYLKNTVTRVAAVTGNFPTGQSLLKNKLQETRHAIDEGADEIDYVYNIGNMIDGRYQEVVDELNAVREVCKNTQLKVILETGFLNSLREVKIASEIALRSGVDFIKTSTGKSKPGATLETAFIMLTSIRKIFDEEEKKIGVKFSGGIASKEELSRYYYLTEIILGREWMNPGYFRIGAGALATRLLDNGLQKLNKA